MKLVVENYWNKIEKVKNFPFGVEVLSEYEKSGSSSFPNGGGWKSREDWREAVRQRSDFIGFEEDKAIIDLGKRCGIHLYQLVYLVEG